MYKPSWGEWENWQHKFSEDVIDGQSGYELKFEGEKVITRYLRVGYDCDGSWRTFSLRKDFLPAKKLQREDDISVSATLKVDQEHGLHPEIKKGRTNLLKIVNIVSSKDQTTHSSEDMIKKQKRIFQNRGIFSQTTNPLVGPSLRTLLPTRLTLNNIRLR